MNKYIATILLILSLSAALFAQTHTPLPYFEGFEYPQTAADWHLNVGADGFTNKWYISSAESYMGTHSLLISDNNGASATYANTSNTVVAHREFLLTPGQYDLSFAWRCQGETDVDGLYVCWVPASVDISSSVMGLPRVVENMALDSGSGKKIFNGGKKWQDAVFKVTVTPVPGGGVAAYKLVFVWDNNKTVNAGSSVCIDNIQLASSKCTVPESFGCSFSGFDAELSWKGSAKNYQVGYKSYKSKDIVTAGVVTETTATIKDLTEDLYDFYVRSICEGGDTGIWIGLRNQLLYNGDAHCIDFANLNGDSTECTIGLFDNPYKTDTVLNLGSESVFSRHTIHYFPDEFDPRTNNGLRTIPDGEILSVRLGNWDINKQAESVTYTYTLPQSEKLIMLLKYAVVFQDPKHDPSEQPRFTMEILDRNGKLIDNSCGAADFRADRNAPGWNSIENGSDVIVWKNWTTVGVNLQPYAGQTIKIRFTTYDCDAGGHYGYAYYTLSCAQAEIEGVTCGALMGKVTAPEGFDYAWYKPESPEVIVSTDRVLQINESEADTFNCDVIFKEKKDCRFTLTANLLPRYPKADFVPEWCPDSCRNYVRFRNTSGVTVSGKMTGEQCTSYMWDFGNGIVSSAKDTVLEFPAEGGVYNVQLLVGISDDMCVDDTTITVTVPPVMPTDTTIYRTLCSGGRPIVFGGKQYKKEGVYEIREVATTSCDSVITLVIEAVDEVADTIADTICAGEVYLFCGMECTEQRTYSKRYTGGSAGGCDSVAVLNLTVVDTFAVSLADVPEVCADDEAFDIPYVVESGETDSYALIFGEVALAAGFVNADSLPLADGVVHIPLPDGVRPDHYSVGIRFNVDECSECVDTIQVPFCVHYPSSILAQKWNDVIAIYNSAHPLGGYEFSAYCWYRNDEQIVGETAPYLYLGEGGQLDAASEYRAGLVRRGETDWITTCSIEPEVRTDVSQYITVGSVVAGQRIEVSGIRQAGIARWYTIAGQSLYVEEVDCTSAFITAPSVPGIYLVHLILGNETSVRKIIVE